MCIIIFTSQYIISVLIMGRGQWVQYPTKRLDYIDGEKRKTSGPPAKWKRVKGPTPIDAR